MNKKVRRLIPLNAFVEKHKAGRNKAETTVVKYFTFMVEDEKGIRHISLPAFDRETAEQRIAEQCPGCRTRFLWEYIRSTPGDWNA